MSTRNDIINNLAEGIMKLNGDPAFGEVTIAKVFRYYPQIDQLNEQELPCVVIDDNQNIPGPEYNGVARFATTLNLTAFVVGDHPESLVEKIEQMSDALTKYIYKNPTIHDNVLSIRLVERDDIGIFTRSNQHFAEVLLSVRLLWFDTVGTVVTPSGTDVFGTQWLDDARDKLVARLNALKTTMSTGYDPTFSFVHERHVVPDLKLNAVSVGIQDASQEEFGGASTGVSWTYNMKFTVRIHVAYSDEIMDDQMVGRLINSIVNQLRAQQDLTGGFWVGAVEDIDTIVSFDESETQGGEFAVQVITHVLHAQV